MPGGSIPELGSFNTVAMAPNVGSPGLSCPSIRYSRFVTNTGLQYKMHEAGKTGISTHGCVGWCSGTSRYLRGE